jgi:branched-subunit amino acid transport protein
MGGRDLPPRLAAVVALLAPALLAALVVSETVGGDGGLVLARLAGVAAAAAGLAARAPVLLTVGLAAGVTALLRAVS